MQNRWFNSILGILMPIVLLISSQTFASHLAGGGFIYRYLGDTVISGNNLHKYEITLELFQDCVTGVPDAIAQDNPAFLNILDASNNRLVFNDTALYFDPNPASGGSIIIPASFASNSCDISTEKDINNFCMLKKTFKKVYYLPPNAAGYIVVYQRCCRGSSIANVQESGDYGVTFFCTIPGDNINNSSAVFKNDPTILICNRNVINIDHSATDANGDSLSYEFYAPFLGAFSIDIKPKMMTLPPYDTVIYVPGFSTALPVSGNVVLNPLTGELSLSGGSTGSYLIGVKCNEWRNGTIINTVYREMTWTSLKCNSKFKPFAGPDRVVLVNEPITFVAQGAARYLWLPANNLSNPYIGNPTATYTKPGRYTYVLLGENQDGCNGSDTLTIEVVEHSGFTLPNAFTPNGDGINDILLPISIRNSTLKSFNIYNRWGDMVYSSGDANAGWDGTYKGSIQNSGVFVWTVEYVDNNGVVRRSNGTTILIR